MNISLFAESLNESYFRALYKLAKDKKIQLTSYSLFFIPEILKLIFKSKNTDKLIPIKQESIESKPKKSFFSRLSEYLQRTENKHDIFLHPFRLIISLRSDIVVIACSPYHAYIYLFTIYRLLNKKIVFSTSWPYWNGKKYVFSPNILSKYLWKIFLKNRIVHTVTQAAADELHKIGAKTYVIPHPVDTEIFVPKPTAHHGIRILYVGRLVEEKGVLLLLDIAKSNNFKDKDIEFWFVGSGELSSYIKIQENKLPIKLITHINSKTELAKIYNHCDIFVLPSFKTETWEELFGITLVEAMSCGLPVIATDCTGPKEIVVDSKNGFLIKQKDTKELITKLRKLVEDKFLREAMGKNGRQHVLKKYDLKKIVKQWEDLLNQV